MSLEEENIEIVLRFLKAIEVFDYDTAWELVSDDLHYRNHPFPATHTKESSLKQLKVLFAGMHTFKCRVLHIAANDGTVLNERRETFIAHIFHIDLPVTSIFQVRDGKIYEWRDHFDFLTLMINSIKSPFFVIAKLFGKKFD